MGSLGSLRGWMVVNGKNGIYGSYEIGATRIITPILPITPIHHLHLFLPYSVISMPSVLANMIASADYI